ncbi:YihY/virulence factor BrkB family protein [Desulfonatronovibrio hydrogenovorans]|uniref:YihY/virulence factor BrkB family protein n=1 Tax=Desulfonatronovibrio hydrogenovorans TaxID=53245 RepID=UPI0006909704|nr:YihY/virulence factor BrkB family protein [Desulfonatronovibrio hydrogenovorans]
MFRKIIEFLQTTIWRIDISNLSGFRAFLVHHLRVILVAVREFAKDDCMRRASALTYYTLLSIVPVLAMAFGIAKGFGLEDALNRQIEYYLGSHEEILEQVIGFSYSLLEETRGGLIAGIGFLFLLWSVLKVLTNIEYSFNAIWGVNQGRGWVKKITEYMSIMLIAPVVVVLSGSMTLYISTELSQIVSESRWLSFMSFVADLAPRVLPYMLIWMLFTFLLMAMPNTRVRLKPALAAGIISGTLFQLMQWAYISLQVGAVKYNAVYGSFAALPMFLIWLQLSWMIVLLGAELSFAYENVKRYIFASEIKKISLRYKQKISLLVLHQVITRFMNHGEATSLEEICQSLGLPPRLVNQVTRELLAAGLMVEISSQHDADPLYQPGLDINTITLGLALKKMDQSGTTDIPVADTKAWEKISETLDGFQELVEKSPGNILLKDL